MCSTVTFSKELTDKDRDEELEFQLFVQFLFLSLFLSGKPSFFPSYSASSERIQYSWHKFIRPCPIRF